MLNHTQKKSSPSPVPAGAPVSAGRHHGSDGTRRHGVAVLQGAQRRAEVAGGGGAGGTWREARAETAGGDGEGSPQRRAGAETARGSSSGVRARNWRGDGARQQLRGAAAAAHGGGGMRRTREEGEGWLGLSEGDGWMGLVARISKIGRWVRKKLPEDI